MAAMGPMVVMNSPAGTEPARSFNTATASGIVSTCSRGVCHPGRLPTSTMWLWASMMPGMTVLPRRSTTLRPPPRRTTLLPTASKRPLRMRSCETTRPAASIVWIRPLIKPRSTAAPAVRGTWALIVVPLYARPIAAPAPTRNRRRERVWVMARTPGLEPGARSLGSLGPAIPMLRQRQRAHAHAAGSEDGVCHGRQDRRQRRLAQPGRRVVGLQPVRLDHGRRLCGPQQRHLMQVGLCHLPALHRDLLHQVADALDHTALYQVLGVHRVDDLAADVARHPHLVDLDPLVGAHRHFGHFREVAAVAVLESHTDSGTLGPRRAPVALLRHQLQHADHPRGVEAVAAALRSRIRLVGQQVEPELDRILAGRMGQLVKERLEHERVGVAARRPKRTGGHAERYLRVAELVVRGEQSRELDRPDGRRAGI